MKIKKTLARGSGVDDLLALALANTYVALDSAHTQRYHGFASSPPHICGDHITHKMWLSTFCAGNPHGGFCEGGRAQEAHSIKARPYHPPLSTKPQSTDFWTRARRTPQGSRPLGAGTYPGPFTDGMWLKERRREWLSLRQCGAIYWNC